MKIISEKYELTYKEENSWNDTAEILFQLKNSAEVEEIKEAAAKALDYMDIIARKVNVR